ncbi:hypothetical protein HDU98_006884 [Podochytrium sp. JEL0797]|nr:hypothetical protein HDU98_006884 [Podochytrium sp. JEL0797]
MVESTKESMNRYRFSAGFSAESSHTISTLHYSNLHGAKSASNLVQSLTAISEQLEHSEWILFLEEGALFADPNHVVPFSQQIEAFALTNQLFIVFTHCHTAGVGSILVHTSMREQLQSFVRSFDPHKPESYYSVSRKLKEAVGAALSTLSGTSLFTCAADWLQGDANPSHFLNFTIHDRISADTLRLTADYYYGNMAIPDLMHHSLKNRMILRIEKGENASLISGLPTQNGSVIFVDGSALPDFVINISPQITKSYVLISGDGDPCMPECLLEKSQTEAFASSSLLLGWYATNCKGIEAAHGKISCMPIGVDQWGDKREKLQTAYRQGFGLKHGLEWNSGNVSGKHERYVLASFGINTNPPLRQAVYDLFCVNSNTTRDVNSVMNCQFGQVDQLTFYTKVLANSRFAISPHGNGLDCYRTYEALFMNVIPIVVTSSLDPLYENLPVLILKSWEDLTLELMEETELKFAARKWNLRKLYADYWYHKVREGL